MEFQFDYFDGTMQRSNTEHDTHVHIELKLISNNFLFLAGLSHPQCTNNICNLHIKYT